MFRIKVCGVTRLSDAADIAAAGADAIGLNFYERSPRCVTANDAEALATAVKGGPLVVGVFVNATADWVTQVANQVPLGAIQLHGDEPPEFAASLPSDLPVIRAFRIDDRGLEPAAQHVEECRKRRPLDAVLLDAAVTPAEGEPQAYGGTGERLDWAGVGRERGVFGSLPVILAGGLRPRNVARAIELSGADGVDTASGVESSPGVKDADRVRRFVEAAKTGFAAR
ncbi:MAG: phosphoribosylanthranilate isomerase [Planctomycetota bacterium]